MGVLYEDGALSVINAVQNALVMIDSQGIDQYERGLNLLEDCERSVANSIDQSDSALMNHILSWTQLEHAAVLADAAQFGASGVILERVRNRSELLDRQFGAKAFEFGCNCFEYETATLEYANGLASSGQYASGIQVLKRFEFEPQSIHHVLEEDSIQQMYTWLNAWGTALGFDNVGAKLGLFYWNSPSEVASKTRQWSFPTPIRGRQNTLYRREFYHLVNERRNVRLVPPTEHYELTQELCRISRQWSAARPNSVEPKYHFVNELLAKAAEELHLHAYDSYAATIAESLQVLAKVFPEYPEYVQMKLGICRAIFDLVQTLFRHSYFDEWLRISHAEFGRELLQAAMYELENIRLENGVSQAIAITECTVLSLAALGQEMIGKTNTAIRQRDRRDAILSELLRRDPENSYALRLSASYEPSRSSRTGAELVEEVRNWNWCIVTMNELVSSESTD
jgi:hypothetical protein